QRVPGAVATTQNRRTGSGHRRGFSVVAAALGGPGPLRQWQCISEPGNPCLCEGLLRKPTAGTGGGGHNTEPSNRRNQLLPLLEGSVAMTRATMASRPEGRAPAAAGPAA